jgi:hypothetical protein
MFRGFRNPDILVNASRDHGMRLAISGIESHGEFDWCFRCVPALNFSFLPSCATPFNQLSPLQVTLQLAKQQTKALKYTPLPSNSGPSIRIFIHLFLKVCAFTQLSFLVAILIHLQISKLNYKKRTRKYESFNPRWRIWYAIASPGTKPNCDGSSRTNLF